MAITSNQHFGNQGIGEGEAHAQSAASVWVVGFDKTTGERSVFTICPRASALFHAARYELDGYNVKIFEGWEMDEMLDGDRSASACR